MADCFVIRGLEAGGSQAGKLQYQSDAENDVWTNLGDWVANNNVINIDGTENTVEIDYNIFSPGTYYFRLIDVAGNMVSNIVALTFESNVIIAGDDGTGISGDTGEGIGG